MSRTPINQIDQGVVGAEVVNAELVPVKDTTITGIMTELTPDAIADRLSAEVKDALDKRVKSFIAELEKADLDSADLDRLIVEVREFGNREIFETSNTSSKLLQMREVTLNDKTENVENRVANNLVEFRRVLDDLNPDKKKKFLGFIPVNVPDPVADWKRRYESSQDHLDSILEKLIVSESDIRLSNQALAVERTTLRDQAQKLLKVLYMSNGVQNAISDYTEKLEYSDPSKAMALRTSIESTAVQKGNDLKVHALTMAQNFKALELTLKSNESLISNLYRARTTTVSALRGAVLMRNALNQQKNVSNQITAVQQMTGDYLVNVSENVKDNAATIEAQSQNTMIDLDKLRTAYNNIVEAAQNAENSRLQALENMKVQRQALEDFSVEASDSLEGGRSQSATPRVSGGKTLSI